MAGRGSIAGNPDLILPLRKPVGWSSFDVVRLVKKATGAAKVGHAGTLDPFASGLLLVCTGRATKRINELVEASKEYTGRIRLGVETDTLDISGRMIRQESIPPLDYTSVAAVAAGFVGEIEQIPPVFSALHVGGHRWYTLARAGVAETPKPRRVVIHALEVTALTPQGLDFIVTCSKGTYIRSLARDLARALGTAGFLSQLIRVRIGDHRLSDALEVTELPRHLKNS